MIKAPKQPKITFTNPEINPENDWTGELKEPDLEKLTPEQVVQEMDKRYVEHNQHITKEMFDALVKGFKGLKAFEKVEIHGDEGDVREEILRFLRDCTFDKRIYEKYRDHPRFKESLIRDMSSLEAL